MLLFVPSLALLALAPSLTIETQGSTVASLVKAMAEQSGHELGVNPDIASDRIVAHMDHVSLDDAMKALAQQELGKWVQAGERTTFERDAIEVQREQKAERDDRVKLWQHKLVRMQVKMGGQSFSSDDASRVARDVGELTARYHNGDLNDFVRLEEAGYEVPSGRALVRVLTEIGPERLAQYPTGFVEFSTHPGSLQQPIGDGSSAILDTYKQEQKQWNSLVPDKPGKLGLSQEGAAPADLASATGMYLKLAAHGSGGVAVLIVYDKAGKMLAQTVSTLSVDGVQAMHDEEKKDAEDVVVATWERLPELSRELYHVRDERVKDDEIRQIWTRDKQFREALEHPEIADLDGLIFGQQVLALGRAKHLNIIVPEFSTLARFLPESGFKDGLLNVNVLKTRLDNSAMSTDLPNWFLIRKTAKIVNFEEGQGSSDPAKLGSFFRGAMKADEILLDDVAQLYVGSKGLYGLGGSFGLVSSVIGALKPDLPGWGWMRNSPMALAFYGSLNAEQHQVASSASLSLAALTADNWSPLTEDPWMLEGAIDIPSLGDRESKSIYSDPFVFFGLTDSKQGTLRFEIGEELTIGIDTDGYFNFQDKEGWSRRMKANSERGNHDPKYRPANRKTIKMRFAFANKAEMNLQLDCDDPTGPIADNYNALPQEIRSQFPMPTKQ